MNPMSGLMTEPEGGDENRGPHLSALVLTECAVAFVVLSLRMYSRFMIRGLGWDDYLMLLTLVRASSTRQTYVEF